MKIIFCLISVSFFLTPIIFAQTSNWYVLPNSPSTSWRQDDLSFINENTGWVVYNTMFGGGDIGKVYKTTNGGTSWIMQKSVSNIYLRCIGFTDSLNGFIGTLGNLLGLFASPIMYKTTNGGTTWDTVAIVNNRPSGLCGISVFDKNNIFMCGRIGGPPYFMKTTNGGINWISQHMDLYASDLVDCKFFTPDSGFVVGGVDTPSTNTKGLILFTSNGGTNWIESFKDTRLYDGLWKISFPTRTTGYVSVNINLGNDSVFVIKTTNGGFNWTRIGYPVSNNQTQGIGFFNENTGWVGGFGSTYKTTDGGFTWQPDNFAVNLNRIRFLNDSVGYGAGQRIYKFSSGQIGIREISNEVPKQFSLEQNYPNPFNPATKIIFDIPHQSFTKITIYDILGRVVAILLNEPLKAGVYETEWDATNFPSGMYFYKLQADDFSESKKMILIK